MVQRSPSINIHNRNLTLTFHREKLVLTRFCKESWWTVCLMIEMASKIILAVYNDLSQWAVLFFSPCWVLEASLYWTVQTKSFRISYMEISFFIHLLITGRVNMSRCCLTCSFSCSSCKAANSISSLCCSSNISIFSCSRNSLCSSSSQASSSYRWRKKESLRWRKGFRLVA